MQCLVNRTSVGMNAVITKPLAQPLRTPQGGLAAFACVTCPYSTPSHAALGAEQGGAPQAKAADLGMCEETIVLKAEVSPGL